MNSCTSHSTYVKMLKCNTDCMTQVVRLVGEHMSGKSTLSPLQLSHNNVQLKDIATLLKQRQAAMRLKPTDTNAATHLIRYIN